MKVSLKKYIDVLDKQGYSFSDSARNVIEKKGNGYAEISKDGSIKNSYLRKLGFSKKEYKQINKGFSQYGGNIDWLIVDPEQYEEIKKPSPSFGLRKTIHRFVADEDVKGFVKGCAAGNNYFSIKRNTRGKNISFELDTSADFEGNEKGYRILKNGLDDLEIRTGEIPWNWVGGLYLAVGLGSLAVGSIVGGFQAVAAGHGYISTGKDGGFMLDWDGWVHMLKQAGTFFLYGEGGYSAIWPPAVAIAKGKDILEEPLKRPGALRRAREKSKKGE